MLFLAILFIGFFFEYAITPIYQVISEGVFHLSLQTVSYCLTAVNVVAMVIVACSWVRARRASAGSAPLCSPSWPSSQASCSQHCSCAPASGSSPSSTRSSRRAGRAIYTPIYDGASAACPQNHSGRSVGICDLMINGHQPSASLSTAR